MINKSVYTSNSDTWETPDDLFDKLNDEFHFDIDLCANEFNHKLERYYTEENSALEKEWTGTCWMNPPYGKKLPIFVKKAHESPKAIIVALLPCRCDTVWWHRYIINTEIRFINKRLKFKNSNNMAPFPSVISIFGSNKAGTFSSWGYRS